MTRRKPTRGDLIALLTWAASEAGTAKNEHDNDRSRTGFEDGQRRLEQLRDRLFEAAGHFPPAKKSPWTQRDTIYEVRSYDRD